MSLQSRSTSKLSVFTIHGDDMSMMHCHECGDLWDTKSAKGLEGEWTADGNYICPHCVEYLMEMAEELNQPQERDE